MKALMTYLLVFVSGIYALDCSGKKNGASPPRTIPLGEYQYTGYG